MIKIPQVVDILDISVSKLHYSHLSIATRHKEAGPAHRGLKQPSRAIYSYTGLISHEVSSIVAPCNHEELERHEVHHPLGESIVFQQCRIIEIPLLCPDSVSSLGTMNTITSDVDTLSWNKECFFKGDKIGTKSMNRAWVDKEARNLRMWDGGLSLLHW